MNRPSLTSRKFRLRRVSQDIKWHTHKSVSPRCIDGRTFCLAQAQPTAAASGTTDANEPRKALCGVSVRYYDAVLAFVCAQYCHATSTSGKSAPEDGYTVRQLTSRCEGVFTAVRLIKIALCTDFGG